MIPTREQAWDLLCEYNEGEFHRLHARIVGDVMRYFAAQLGYADEADFWQTVGILHDLDFEQYPDQHCTKEAQILRERGVDERLVHAVVSHGYLLTVDVQPEHQMEKVLYATDELTGLIGAVVQMLPTKSVQDLQLKSLKKKFKDKKFAAGCSREVIERGADMLGWSLDELMERTITAMQASRLPMETEKVLVAMSGGVDSSVAAKLLTDAGFSCIGCTMKLYDNEDAGIPKANTCCSLDDVEDARSVAYRLGMPYYVFNLKDKFAECVIDRFVDAYEHGITPNPCIDCNRYLKFDKLFERADIMGCRYIATGHYARIEREGEKYVLKKALDETKDQSYVLYDLTQETLARVKFPLGSLRKTEAREIAAEAGLINARKHDSQDICFVPDGDYAKVIENRTGKTPEPGPFLDLNGNVIGTHRGIIHYTVGQRRGLRMPSDGKIYVVRILPEQNAVVVGPNEALFTRACFVPGMHWISGEAPALPFRCSAKTRYRQPEQPCTVYPAGAHGVRLVFDEPLRAITPGQSAVLYDGDMVLGGGIIAREDAAC